MSKRREFLKQLAVLPLVGRLVQVEPVEVIETPEPIAAPVPPVKPVPHAMIPQGTIGGIPMQVERLEFRYDPTGGGYDWGIPSGCEYGIDAILSPDDFEKALGYFNECKDVPARFVIDGSEYLGDFVVMHIERKIGVYREEVRITAITKEVTEVVL